MKADLIPWVVAVRLVHHYRTQVKLVDAVKAKRALLPAALTLKLKVLEHAWPAVDVATLCNAWTDHFTQGLHANGALDA